ncbi:MAG TPA: hypothetical protein VFI42_13165 [Thermomicrobiaceae bacterium]|nr:hypothetical protein [Thermomicrobiaceae bacterium]
MAQEIKNERRSAVPVVLVTTANGAHAYVNLNYVVGVVEMANEHVTRVYFSSGPIQFVDVQQTPDQIVAQAGITSGNIQI